MSDFNLNDHVYRLLQSEPFFAALSRRIEKKANKQTAEDRNRREKLEGERERPDKI